MTRITDGRNTSGDAAQEQFALRRFSPLAPRAVVIGASTGGPQALTAVVEGIRANLTAVPLFIVMHLPPDFAPLLAAQIHRRTGLTVAIAENGVCAKPGHIYIAPGGLHLRLRRIGQDVLTLLSDGPLENFCRPAVDVLFRSAADAYGSGLLGVVLTGMGQDGLSGAQAIVDSGGSVVVQDRSTSTVWGMPGAIARQGLASAILPLSELSSHIDGMLTRSSLGARA